MLKRISATSPRPVGSALWGRFADLHSHIIPGVDDGSPTIEESLAMIREAYKSGVRVLCATSHIREGWRSPSQLFRQKFDQLIDIKNEAGMTDLVLHLSAEYMLDDHFFSLLHNNDVLPLPGNMLLVETSYYAPALNLDDMLFEITTKGYTPLIAHPERYGYYQRAPKQYAHFKEKRYPFQLDLLSLQGYYGKSAQKTAIMLLEKGYIDFVGSDMHSLADAEALSNFIQSPASAPLNDLIIR